jgi:hypothetical protein
MTGERRWHLLAATLGFVAAYYALLLGVLIIRFGDWPNYVTLHDWPGNVARIVRATPAVTDMAPIILDEWLLEIGYMNRDYGLGIAEWTLTILPAKLLLVTLTGLLLGTNLVLMRMTEGRCAARHRHATALAVGSGTAVAALAATTMTWVVCCASPSWAVTLAMLGMGVSTALWLEPLGAWLQVAGLSLLALSAAVLTRRFAPAPVVPAGLTALTD